MLPPIEFSTGRIPCVAAASCHGREHVVEGFARDEIGVVAEMEGRRLTVGAGLSLIGNAHGIVAPRRVRLHRRARRPERPRGRGGLRDRVPQDYNNWF